MVRVEQKLPDLSMPAFDDVQTALDILGALGEAAQTHGLLCAFFACGTKIKRQAWVQSLLNQQLDKSNLSEVSAQEVLTDLFTYTQEAFTQDHVLVSPLLPKDEVPLNDRIDQLAEFAKGFLMGLNLAGIKLKNNENTVLQEALDDFLNISCLVPQDESGEEAEKNFFELVEYLKVAMGHIYWELKDKTQAVTNLSLDEALKSSDTSGMTRH